LRNEIISYLNLLDIVDPADMILKFV